MPIRQGQMHTHCMVHADSDTLDIERSQSLSGMSVEHERFSHEGPFSKDSVYDLEKLVIVQYKRRHCIHEEFTSPARSVEWETLDHYKPGASLPSFTTKSGLARRASSTLHQHHSFQRPQGNPRGGGK